MSVYSSAQVELAAPGGIAIALMERELTMARSDMIREALRKGGNPYASLQIEDGEHETPLVVTQAATDGQHARSENPYSRHYYFADEPSEADAHDAAAHSPAATVVGKLSKSSFQQQVRAIFRPYIPAAESGHLRDHHREFIARNETRSATTRYRLVAQLKRYDLGDLPQMKPLFNREDAIFTKEKLAEIERIVGADD
jgi:hypothetical protein